MQLFHSAAQPQSHPLSSAPQRFALAHQAPRESLLLAGGCGGFSQGMVGVRRWDWGREAGRWFTGMSDGLTDGCTLLTAAFLCCACSRHLRKTFVPRYVSAGGEKFSVAGHKL